MKRALVLAVALTLISGIAAFAKGDGPGGVASTAHNLATQSTQTTHAGATQTQQICVFCHAPHNTDAAQLVPLWNHATTTATFTNYTSSTMDGTSTVAGASKACLSCHDGTIGIGSVLYIHQLANGTDVGGATTLTMVGNVGASPYAMTGAAKLGIDLSNDHPIGLDYATIQTADTGIQATTYILPSGSPGGTTTANLLIGGKVECGSCHAVHGFSPSWTVPAGRTATDFDPLLRVSKYNSELCVSCHIK